MRDHTHTERERWEDKSYYVHEMMESDSCNSEAKGCTLSPSL